MSNLFSRLFLRANIVTAAMACLLLVACGDDDSSFAPRDSDDSSSSICENSSSSRHCEDCKDEAISSNKDDVKSSSSVTPKSNDSETSVSSTSTKSSYSSAKADGSEYDSTANTLKDLRNGQTYRTVKIGGQVWMAENLNFETDNSFCYNDSAEYCEKYGRLYTWAAAMDSAVLFSNNGKGCGFEVECMPTYPVRGICPSGWHLPSKEEWQTLHSAVVSIADSKPSTEGALLKSTSGWNRSGNGTDAFGFSALPAGSRNDGWGRAGSRNDGRFRYSDEGDCAIFWSSTQANHMNVRTMSLLYDLDIINVGYCNKYMGNSVRCLKN